MERLIGLNHAEKRVESSLGVERLLKRSWKGQSSWIGHADGKRQHLQLEKGQSETNKTRMQALTQEISFHELSQINRTVQPQRLSVIVLFEPQGSPQPRNVAIE